MTNKEKAVAVDVQVAVFLIVGVILLMALFIPLTAGGEEFQRQYEAYCAQPLADCPDLMPLVVVLFVLGGVLYVTFCAEPGEGAAAGVKINEGKNNKKCKYA